MYRKVSISIPKIRLCFQERKKRKRGAQSAAVVSIDAVMKEDYLKNLFLSVKNLYYLLCSFEEKTNLINFTFQLTLTPKFLKLIHSPNSKKTDSHHLGS